MENGNSNPIADKSFQFAIRVVNLYRYLCSEKESNSMLFDCTELEKLLTSIIKSAKSHGK